MDLNEVMTTLGNVVLERTPDGRFIARARVPEWCRRLRSDVRWELPIVIEDVFPFLSVFLPEAERAWSGELTRVDSDLWAESLDNDDDDKEDVHLAAIALRVSDACALLVMRSERRFHEEQALLQRGRELKLTHDALMRELDQKDILTHAIVHDLAAPLHTILGVLSLLVERTRGEPESGWLKLATEAASRQRELIDEILDVFVAEDSAIQNEELASVELSSVIQRVVAERAPLARSRSVRIDAEPGPICWVVGDERRLFRVLTNLLDNAVRFSPQGGCVRISTQLTSLREDAHRFFRPQEGACVRGTTHDEGEAVTVVVDDDGPGAAPDVLPRLFEKFGRARGRTSGTGLGLFFCRITVEGWGGSIGYEQRDTGGARFWIRLRLAPSVNNTGNARPRTSPASVSSQGSQGGRTDGKAALAR